jgi:quercetin dioxygenase-like cupin family protein
MDFKYIADLASEIGEIPPDGILSRTLYKDEKTRLVVFGFAPGQELSEHTAAVPAVLFFVSGEAELTLGTESKPAGPGTWVHMAPHLPHSIAAKTPLVMALVLIEA